MPFTARSYTARFATATAFPLRPDHPRRSSDNCLSRIRSEASIPAQRCRTGTVLSQLRYASLDIIREWNCLSVRHADRLEIHTQVWPLGEIQKDVVRTVRVGCWAVVDVRNETR